MPAAGLTFSMTLDSAKGFDNTVQLSRLLTDFLRRYRFVFPSKAKTQTRIFKSWGTKVSEPRGGGEDKYELVTYLRTQLHEFSRNNADALFRWSSHPRCNSLTSLAETTCLSCLCFLGVFNTESDSHLTRPGIFERNVRNSFKLPEVAATNTELHCPPEVTPWQIRFIS